MDDSALSSSNDESSRLSGLLSGYRYRKVRRRKGKREARRIRESDFVLFSPGNSGRTWLRSMLTSIFETYYGLDSSTLIDFDNLHKLDARVPKIFVTHNRWLPYYRKELSGSECAPYYNSKLLALVRNPIDTCVSQYFQWLHRSKEFNVFLKEWPARSSGMELEDFLDHPVTGLGRLCDELNIWLRESAKMRHARFVRYEDLLSDTENGLAMILDFFEVPVPKDVIRDAVEINSFENMQKREVSDDIPGGSHSDPNESDDRLTEALKARRGKIGGYANEISEERCLYYQKLVGLRLSHEFGYYDLPSITPVNTPRFLK